MSRRLRWILIIVASVIAAIFIGFYITLISYDYNNLKPTITKTIRDATGRKLTIGGDIDLAVGFTPSLVLSDIQFENAEWGSEPELAKIKRFEVKVALFPLLGGNIEMKKLVLVEPDILIESDKTGKLNLEFSPQKEEETPEDGQMKLPPLTFINMKIEKGRIVYKDHKSGKAYDVMLKSVTAKAPDFATPLKISSKGSFNKESLNVSGTLGPISEMVDPEAAWPINLAIKVANATVDLQGTLKDVLTQSGLDMGFKVKASNPAKLARLVGIEKPLPANEPFEVSGRVSDIKPDAYKISDFKATIGSSDIAGSMEIRLPKNRLPKLTADLTSRKIDARPFLSKDKKTSKKEDKSAKEKKKEKLFPDTPLPLDLLELAEGDIKIKAGQIILPKLALTDLSASINARRGHLTVKPINASIGGGTLNGHITLESRGNSATVNSRLDAKAIDIKNMLKVIDINDVMEGNFDTDIDIHGYGTSIANIMANLNGHTYIIMSDGQIKNRFIDILGADISASIYRLLNPFKKKLDHTRINCMVSRFDIKDGIAENTVMVINTDHMVVVGKGKIDLKTEKLNMPLKPLPKDGIGFNAVGKLTLSLGELAKPFKVGGTLAKPSLAIDLKQTAFTLGKAVGGVALFGPVGIAAVLIGKSAKDKNPCLVAIEAAKKGVSVKEIRKSMNEKGVVGKSVDKVKGAGKGIGKTFKKIFGKDKNDK